MLGRKEESTVPRSGDLNTIVGKGSSLEGTLKVENSIRVDGKVKGNISTNDSLIVGRQGEIEGEVVAKNAIIGGKVQGKVKVSGKVVLESKAIFHGEMKAARLVIDDGAVFDGKCSMKDDEKSPLISRQETSSQKPDSLNLNKNINS